MLCLQPHRIGRYVSLGGLTTTQQWVNCIVFGVLAAVGFVSYKAYSTSSQALAEKQRLKAQKDLGLDADKSD